MKEGIKICLRNECLWADIGGCGLDQDSEKVLKKEGCSYAGVRVGGYGESSIHYGRMTQKGFRPKKYSLLSPADHPLTG